MKNNGILSLFIAFVLILMASSCRTSKKLVTGNKTYTYAQISESFVTNNELPESLSSKISVAVTDSKNKTIKLGGTLRMVKDSAVWLSLSPGFGLEVARILVRPDSFFVVDRLKSTAYIGSVNQLANLYGFDVQFRFLQAVLLDAYNGSGYFEVNKKLFRSFSQGANIQQNIICFSGQKTYLETYNLEQFCFDENSFKFTGLKLSDSKENKLALAYANFQDTDNFLIPSHIAIAITANNEQQMGELQIKKATINQPVKLSFRIPSKYKTVIVSEKL